MTPAFGVRAPRFRLPGTTRVGRVRLQVADLHRSLAYYQDVIGLRPGRREDGVTTLAPHGDDAVLIELHERPGTRPVPRGGLLGLYHFAILLPDRAELGRFIAHIASRREAVGMADHAVSEAVYLTDPDGLGIEVYADRPRAAWSTDGAELHMTTQPLNVEDLFRAAAGGAWSGMPVGTVIGHVHLHVGSLEGAEAFYHEAIGFDKTVWSYPGALFLSAGGYHHHLGTNTWRAGSPPASEADARLLDWEIVLPDAAAVLALSGSLEAAGRRVDTEAGARSAADPWGTRVRFTAPRRSGAG